MTTGSSQGGRLRPSAALGLLVTTMIVAGCAVQGLSFVQDTRVQILEPRPNATVRLPLELRWSAESIDAATFAVFFNQTPIRPGETLRAVVPDGDPCRRDPDCPDADWLTNRFIFLTRETSLRVEHLPDRRDTDRARDRHDFTIILLDSEGRRQGESAFTGEFIVDRER